MIEWAALSFLFGIVLAIPLWWLLGRSGRRGGVREAGRVVPREATLCTLEPVVLHGHLLLGVDPDAAPGANE